MDFENGDQVNYVPGYKGWNLAEVIGFDSYTCQYRIRLENGKEIDAWEDELEPEK